MTSTGPAVPFARLLGAPLAGLIALSALGGGPARGAADDHEPARAKELYREARELKEQGRIEASLDKLRAAYEAYPDPAIRISIANRHLDLGQPRKAREVLQRVETDRPQLKKRIEGLRAEIEERLAEPVPVRVVADAEGAEVSVDDGAWRTLPVEMELPPGEHRFRIRAPGRKPVTKTRELAGSVQVPIVASLPPKPGRLRVRTRPKAALADVRVLVDGDRVGLAEEERDGAVSKPRELAPGSYRVACLRGEDDEAEASVRIRPGETTVATCRFDRRPSASQRRRTWGWVTAGGAAVSLGVATFYLVDYMKEQDRFGDDPRYRVDSTKPAASGVLYATGAGLSVLSGFLLAR